MATVATPIGPPIGTLSRERYTPETPISRRVASGEAHSAVEDPVNVGQTERWLSLIGGGLLALQGLRQESLAGLGLATLGGALIYRGLSGHCHLYQALGIDTARHRHGPASSVAAGEGFKITQAVTIDRPPEEVYRYFRDLENLPRFMTHLISVTEEGERTHWKAKAPAGLSVSWDAEVISQEPGRLLAWRSLEGSQVATAGSVHFDPAPGGRGTEVRVTLKYDPPGGTLGGWVAWLFGKEPSRQIGEDLRRLKSLLEGGEIPTAVGQP